MSEQKESVGKLDLHAERTATKPGSGGEGSDDNLLADFDDLADGAAGDGGEVEDFVDLHELEAFLDDFNHDLAEGIEPDDADADDATVTESSSEAQDEAEEWEKAEQEPSWDELEPAEASERPDASTDIDQPFTTPELEEDELDLSTAETANAGQGSSEELAFETLDPDNIPYPAAAADTERSLREVSEPPDDFEGVAERAAPETPPRDPEAPAAASAWDKKRAIIVAALAGAGLIVAAVAGIMTFSLSGQIDELEQAMSNLRQARAVAAPDPRIDEALREARKLDARVNELAIIIEGPISHLRESNERDIRSLSERIAQLEHQIEEVARRPAPAAAKAPPPPVEVSTGWVVNLISVSEKTLAVAERSRLAGLGIDARIQPATVDGKTWYRLRVSGFESKDAAQRFAAKIRSTAGLGSAWVTRD